MPPDRVSRTIWVSAGRTACSSSAEQAVVRPLEVLEHEHERAPLGERLEEPAPGGERLAAVIGGQLLVAREPHERLEVSGDPLRVGRLGNDGPNRVCELLGRDLRRIGLEDAGLGLRHLAQRPVGDPLPVGQRATLAPEDQVGIALDGLEELPDQPGLADPRYAHERQELGLALRPHAGQRVDQQVELLLPPDEWCLDVLGDVDAVSRAGLDRFEDRDRLGLSLGLDRLGLPELDRLLRRSLRSRVDENSVLGSRVLQP